MNDGGAVELRVRPVWQAVQAGTNATLGLVLGILGQGWYDRIMLGVLGAVLAGAYSSFKARKRRLIIDERGLRAVRNGYTLSARWDEVGEVSTERLGRSPFRTETARLRSSVLTRHDGTPLSPGRERDIRRKGADRRVQVGIYVAPSAGGFRRLMAERRHDGP